MDDIVGTTSPIPEYILANNMLMGVVANRQMYFVPTDHIGRPLFATDNTSVKVWEAGYLPFGGVQSSTGPNPSLRFPGQWFQAETGLHQNWMRDYDPTLGRYLQADPLGLVDGASVYGYALQNPGRYLDPRGEACTSFTLPDGNIGLSCNSTPTCLPGADCGWRNPTENIRDEWPEFDSCVSSCLDSEPMMEIESWWPISESTRAQCLGISTAAGSIFRLPKFTSGQATRGCRRDLCEQKCVTCEN